jgi:cyclopropane fatty-acyl-phospholipid synthase-like methyltransferase
MLLCSAVAADPVAKDVPYVPSSPGVTKAMVDLAEVKEGDLVYDLGSGDGRIVIEAAQRGARGIGIEIDPKLVRLAQENAARAGVGEHTEFRQQNLFEVNYRDASVITMYLFPKVNLALRPKLLRELKPGTRVVSHSFDMGDWEPDKRIEVEGKLIYLWVIKAKP